MDAAGFEFGDPMEFDKDSMGHDEDVYIVVCTKCGSGLPVCGVCLTNGGEHLRCKCDGETNKKRGR